MKPSRHLWLSLATLLLLGALLILRFPSILKAQDTACPTLVKAALTTTTQVCHTTDRDQACYGNILVDAQPQPGYDAVTFKQPGDKVNLAGLKSLRLSPMDVTAGVWGLAQLQVRANLPTSQPKNVTILVFGDVQVNNAVTPAPTLDVTTSQPVNVRLMASDKAGIIGSLPAGLVVQAVGRLADNSWLRVKLPESGAFGWVYAPLVTPSGDLGSLQIEAAREPHYEPMQAFYFASGMDANPPCAEVPSNGLLIQTPEGAGKVTLLINEVKIKIGSTVFFQAQAGGNMVISTVEGAASVETHGTIYTAYAGTRVTVPLNADLSPAAAPSAPEPYNDALLQNLPLQGLERAVSVAPPMSQAAIDQQVAQDTAALSGDTSGQDQAVTDNPNNCSGNSCNAPVQGGGNGSSNAPAPAPGDSPPVGGDTCPGNSCNAPGQGGSCPGNSCNAPGHNK